MTLSALHVEPEAIAQAGLEYTPRVMSQTSSTTSVAAEMGGVGLLRPVGPENEGDQMKKSVRRSGL